MPTAKKLTKKSSKKTAAKRSKETLPVPPSTGGVSSPPVQIEVYKDEKELIIEKERELKAVKKKLPAVRPSWVSAEKTLHAAAFQYYYDMGPNRSLTKVAEYFKMNPQTVQTWSSKFKWVKRVEERTKLEIDDTKVHKQSEIDKVKKAVADYLSSKLKGQVEYDENGNVIITNGPIIRSIKDMAEAVSLYREIIGETGPNAGNGGGGNAMQVNFIIKGRNE